MSGLEKSEAVKWRSVIDEACEYVNSRIKKENLTEYDRKRIDLLSAAYAYRLYCLGRSGGVSSFTAGAVRITSSAGETKRAEKLWLEYLSKCGDLVSDGSFLFGTVRI